MSGLGDELEGKAKEEEGNLTGDAKKQGEGAAQKEMGSVDQDAKDKAEELENKL